jgi:hypothetical protein
MARFLERFIGALKLDRATYEEIEANPSAFWQALAVVVLSSMSTAAGVSGRLRAPDLLAGIVGGLLGWAGWAGIAYVVGTRLLPVPNTKADWGELLRTTGFATAPGVLSILGLAPVFTGFIAFVASVWILLAFAVAVRQALDFDSTWRAIGVCLVGWLFYGWVLLGLMSARVEAVIGR